jgi:UDP-3-O-[3-hydroxymyristoyl] glucosamine N-acyltransferase
MIKLLKSEGLSAELLGYEKFAPDHLANLDQAGKNSLTFYTGADPAAVAKLRNCLLVCSIELEKVPGSITCIKTSDPKLAFYILSQEFAPPPPPPGVHPSAIIHPEADIHASVSISPYCTLEKCEIGEGSILHSNVVIYKNTKIGKNVVIESNTCIGATGTNWAWGPDGKIWSLPQLGSVVIEDECFIGTNITISRGSLKENTYIGKGCIIAHGSMIGHNCVIGEKTHLANNITLGGGVTFGKRCFIGSGSSFRPKVKLGDDIIVGTGAVVIHDYGEEGLVLAGIPAQPIKKADGDLKAMPVPFIIKKRTHI